MGREKPGPPNSFVVCHIPPCNQRRWVQGPHQELHARLVHPSTLPPGHAQTVLAVHLSETHGLTRPPQPHQAHLLTFQRNGPRSTPLDLTPGHPLASHRQLEPVPPRLNRPTPGPKRRL